jgi:hypothetical protein
MLQRGDADNRFYKRGVSNTAVLEHLNLWAEKLSRNPPQWGLIAEDKVLMREPFDDGWGQV